MVVKVIFTCISSLYAVDMRGVCQFAAPGQDALVSVVAAAADKVVVAATAPGAMLTPWRDEVQVCIPMIRYRIYVSGHLSTLCVLCGCF